MNPDPVDRKTLIDTFIGDAPVYCRGVDFTAINYGKRDDVVTDGVIGLPSKYCREIILRGEDVTYRTRTFEYLYPGQVYFQRHTEVISLEENARLSGCTPLQTDLILENFIQSLEERGMHFPERILGNNQYVEDDEPTDPLIRKENN